MTKTIERTTVTIDGYTLTFSSRSSRDRRAYASKTRVYGAIDAAADLAALEPKWVAEPVGQVADDVTRVQGATWRGWRDMTKKIVAERLSALIEKLIAEDLHFNELSSAKVTFSQKAGCSCGCSPGFILDGRVHDGAWGGDCGRFVDIWIEKEKESG
jgi:hypothetical protein